MAITITPVAASGSGGVQQDYPLKHGFGRLGAVYDLSGYTSRSKINSTSAVLAFGQPLSPNGEDKVRAYTKANGFAGFALISDTFVPGSKSSTINSVSKTLPGYPEQYVVNVLEAGTIWVYTNTAVSQNDTVALLDAGGDVVVASGTANSTDINAYFLADAAAGELVPIQLGGIGFAPEPAAT
jgi:hypothetical protein